MSIKKTKKRATITIDRDVWALASHFLPPGETRSTYIQKAFIGLIVEHIELLVKMIENGRATNPKECFRYEEWIMSVGLSKYYNEARDKWFAEKKGDTHTARIYDKNDEVNNNTPTNYDSFPSAPVEPPYGKYHRLLADHIHQEPIGFDKGGFVPLPAPKYRKEDDRPKSPTEQQRELMRRLRAQGREEDGREWL